MCKDEGRNAGIGVELKKIFIQYTIAICYCILHFGY